MLFPPLVFAAILIACNCLTTFTIGATLAEDEVDALESIANTLGKTNWNFNIDPCSGDENWTVPDNSFYANNVTCDCSFNNNTACHVVSIVLKGQDLPGTLPPDLVKFRFLQEIDLTRNYLTGNIPKEWGSMHLIRISLLGNRLTGSIPIELGNLSNLTDLVLEQNRLSGTLPKELGDLPNIERMFLNSNKFTGPLPETFARLTTLEGFRISDNNFTGQIPHFIQNWKKLEQLHMHASGLSGPIPSAIDALENITDLRISDLNGAEGPFPPLSNLIKLRRLTFRSCNLIGGLPDSLGELKNLKQLDLSFNRLSGEIPNNISAFHGLDYFYLTGNLFTGQVPDWIVNTTESVDVSYNNFTSTDVVGCQSGKANFFNSTERSNNSGTVSCLGIHQCQKPLNSLHINCGGTGVTVNHTTYDPDIDKAGPSTFVKGGSNWVLSNTGHFLDDNNIEDFLTLGNTSDPELYLTARLSPISLTYYAYCLENRTYSVNLHFAEIQFAEDKLFTDEETLVLPSFGRRIFDVYIQGKRELKDFNIKGEAGGPNKPIVKNFSITVTDGTLEIRLQWAGKGTTAIPERGVYGPLISAISVFDPDLISQFSDPFKTLAPAPSTLATHKPPGGISVAVVVGIVAVAAFAILLFGGILGWKCLKQKSRIQRDLKGIELQTSSFTLRQIKAATNNFDAVNKIGEGGFGPVYKGILADGTAIAVKQLSSRSKQGNREFVTEIGMISALQHPHLVKLYGCCIEGNQLLLIYEYLENNSLGRALFGPEEFQLKLDWPTRRKICIGIARGLAYLHEESRLKIVHRDIKAANVLLDKNLNPKISDFGLAKLDEEDNTHISTRIAGTYGYMAPEYAMHGHLTDKADVYSFGIVALEIVSGKCNTKNRSKEESFYLLDRAHVLKKKGNLLDLVDPRIGSDYNIDEVMAIINVALLCTNPTAAARPSMSSVVSMLEGRDAIQEFFTDSSISANELNVEAMKKLYRKLEENDSDNSQTKSILANRSCTSSSTSAADPYPVNLTF